MISTCILIVRSQGVMARSGEMAIRLPPGPCNNNELDVKLKHYISFLGGGEARGGAKKIISKLYCVPISC